MACFDFGHYWWLQYLVCILVDFTTAKIKIICVLAFLFKKKIEVYQKRSPQQLIIYAIACRSDFRNESNGIFVLLSTFQPHIFDGNFRIIQKLMLP